MEALPASQMSEEHVGTIYKQNVKHIFHFFDFSIFFGFFHYFSPQISWATEVQLKCEKCQKNFAIFDFPNFEELYLGTQKEMEGVLGL